MRLRHVKFPEGLDSELVETAKSLDCSVSHLIREGARYACDQAALRDMRLSAVLAYNRIPRFDFDLDEK